MFPDSTERGFGVAPQDRYAAFGWLSSKLCTEFTFIVVKGGLSIPCLVGSSSSFKVGGFERLVDLGK
jgi:hypothetical protein